MVFAQNKVKPDTLPKCEIAAIAEPSTKSPENINFNSESVIQNDETAGCSSDNNFLQELSTPEVTTENLERCLGHQVEFEEPFQSSGNKFIPDSEDSLGDMSDLDARESRETITQFEERKGRKSRGRKRKISNQSRTDRKKYTNTNKKYISARAKEVEPKTFNSAYSCKCSKKCMDIVPLETRKRLFDQLWGVGGFEGRCVLITNALKKSRRGELTQRICCREDPSLKFTI
ncbi:unnamed protein product [Psylliodes chrysocephalus]|uniref:Uncharacterized protein n=1 Tax=Psylliodes chrysocephalus TaxID=3402493 RepID=A0A9P0GCC0_9CUCU|nr:unnamed protein product [Psylliodes chrysocephala]